MRLSDSNLALIRNRQQYSELSLSIFQPQEVMRCQINDAAVAVGARTITYDTVSSGSFTGVEPGMTLLVGTTPGAKDVGRIRIRSATSSAFTISENSNISWADNLYLTVLRYWEVWPVFPRIITDPSDPEDVIFYKDYDLVYTNQNSVLGTFVNSGPHRAVKMKNGQAQQIYYSSTGTLSLAGVTLAHEWFFEGGTPTGSLVADPGYISYPTAGHYVTRHRVSGTNGAVDTTYRYVSVYDDAHPPIARWKMNDLDGSRGEGGYSVQLTVYDNIQIDDNAVVVLFSDDWYGDTNVSLGGNHPNNSSIFFVGHISKDSIRQDYKNSLVEFSVVSITQLMKEVVGFSISVESSNAPTTWYQLLDLDIRRSIYHYLKWHTTILNVADFQFAGTDQKLQYFDADRESMFDAIDNLMRGTLIGSVCADRQGEIWAEVDPMAYTNPTGSFPPVMEISKYDWMGQPVIEESFSDKVSYIEYGGIQYSGVITGTFSALLGCAPGSSPSFRGKVERLTGLALSSQTHLNSLVGNVFANRNSRFPTANMSMTAGLRNLDIAPQETTRIRIAPDDTIRGISLDRLYRPDNITWAYDPENKIVLPKIVFSNVVSGKTGETIIIPVIPDDGGYGSIAGFGGFKPITLPSSLLAAFSTLTNRAVWQGLATVSTNTDLFDTVYFTGFVTEVNYSTIYGTATGTFLNPTLLTPGIYNIIARFVVSQPLPSDIDHLQGGLTYIPTPSPVSLASQVGINIPLLPSSGANWGGISSQFIPISVPTVIYPSISFVRGTGSGNLIVWCRLSIDVLSLG